MAHQPPPLEVRDTGRYGKGVFAASDIMSGRIIHVLGGDTITLNDLVQRVNSGSERIDDPLQVGLKTYIDLDPLSRTFNHSCSPSAGLRKRSELFALRPILKGEEITYDYSMTIAPTIWKMRCQCGSKDCRRILGDVRTIPSCRLSQYKALGAIQGYMKKLMTRPRWRVELPKYEVEALNTLVRTSEDD